MLKGGRILSGFVFGVVVGSLGLSSFACGGAGPEAKSARRRTKAAVVNPFPSRDSLAKLAAVPVAAAPVREVASSAEWNVAIAPSDAASPAETRFAQVAKKGDANLTYAKELRCVARELGRFQIEHGAPPNERLKRFMIAACGVTNPAVGAMGQTGDAPPEITDEQLLAQWQKTLAIPAEVRGSAVGVWMSRKNKRVVIMTAFAKPQPEVIATPTDAAGLFTVRGSVPANTEYVLGLVNQGDGVTRCEPDLATPLPLFAVRCQMAAEDKTAWVEIAVRSQGRLLLRSYGLALARRDAQAAVQFVAAPRSPKPVASSADLRGALFEGVNRARTASKLRALELAPNQSATNERLAPHFFAASMKSDQQQGDVVGLGLMAGWDVDGTIKHGNLFSALISGTTDANDWLDYALEIPIGRFTMLQPDAHQIAIGVPAPSGVSGLGAVVTTYDLFVGNDHRVDAAHVFEQIAKARSARGLPPPARLEGVAALAAQATLVHENKVDAEDALDAAMVAVRDHSRQAVRGWVLTTSQLEALALPPELLGAGPLSVAVEVTHHKDDGAAWGSYVVFMVMPSPGAGGRSTPQIQATRGGSAHAIGAPSIY